MLADRAVPLFALSKMVNLHKSSRWNISSESTGLTSSEGVDEDFSVGSYSQQQRNWLLCLYLSHLPITMVDSEVDRTVT